MGCRINMRIGEFGKSHSNRVWLFVHVYIVEVYIGQVILLPVTALISLAQT